MMIENMSLYVAFLSRAVGAVGAGEGFLSSVGADVSSYAVYLLCLKGTMGTRK